MNCEEIHSRRERVQKMRHPPDGGTQPPLNAGPLQGIARDKRTLS